ncbi:hypothetical protein OG204_17590 [Streptomyces sp. NBC_01387]|uniref:hypothetical protein n=1 Tax=unclassified Streptomyces TaxID=2593676 RepID=UPI00224CC91F|nr:MULTISPECIES: hypothetical protein [unclassified Streptomyces]MCX4549825.1 hypothetical protein [Streptomyces sp. NBC_01500]WSC21345.1 hypothetical protein OIE60_17575 [Streptomyces sp. NBC_01766]WSV55281.1 hypothetical protein OG282_17135 [Streptomyces sp. NBC_01014]
MNVPRSALLAVLLLGLTACQGSPGTDDAGPAGTATVRPAAGPPGSASAPARLGDTADLRGAGSGAGKGRHLQVTTGAFVDPAITVMAGPAAGPGLRRTGIEFEIVNVGGTAYRAVPGSVWIVDSAGQRHRPVATGDLTTGAPFVYRSLAAGERDEGWFVFEVPETASVASVHFGDGSGADTTTAVWKL